MAGVGKKRIVLQVWIGPEPDEKVKAMMVETSKMPGYVLISDRNFIGAKKWKSAILYCKRPRVEEYVNAVRKQGCNDAVKNTMLSDFIRFHFASEHENVLYMDCDCTMKKEPIIRGTGPFFVGTQTRYIHDLYAFYSKNTEYFSRMIQRILGKLRYTKPYVQMFINSVNGMDDPVRTMNRTCFTHLNSASWVN